MTFLENIRIRGAMMHPTVYGYLKQKSDLLMFIRNNPVWYRYLSRDSSYMNQLEEAAKEWQGKTFQQRAEKLSSQVKMLHLLYELAKSSKEK